MVTSHWLVACLEKRALVPVEPFKTDQLPSAQSILGKGPSSALAQRPRQGNSRVGSGSGLSGGALRDLSNVAPPIHAGGNRQGVVANSKPSPCRPEIHPPATRGGVNSGAALPVPGSLSKPSGSVALPTPHEFSFTHPPPRSRLSATNAAGSGASIPGWPFAAELSQGEPAQVESSHSRSQRASDPVTLSNTRPPTTHASTPPVTSGPFAPGGSSAWISPGTRQLQAVLAVVPDIGPAAGKTSPSPRDTRMSPPAKMAAGMVLQQCGAASTPLGVAAAGEFPLQHESSSLASLTPLQQAHVLISPLPDGWVISPSPEDESKAREETPTVASVHAQRGGDGGPPSPASGHEGDDDEGLIIPGGGSSHEVRLHPTYDTLDNEWC